MDGSSVLQKGYFLYVRKMDNNTQIDVVNTPNKLIAHKIKKNITF